MELFHNNGEGSFQDVTNPSGMEQTSPNLKYLEPPLLLRNESGHFVRVAPGGFFKKNGRAGARRSAISITTATSTSWSATWANGPTCSEMMVGIAETDWRGFRP